MLKPGQNISRLGRIRALPRLGRHPVPPQRSPAGPVSSFPAWAGGQPIPAVGRQDSSNPPGLPGSFHPGWAGTSDPRRGPMLCYPSWAGRPQDPGWASVPCPFQASAPAGLPLHRAPAGPDQEDPAWPGFSSRPPFTSSGWAGLEHSGWARPALPWPRPDYLPGRPDYISTG
jgi:hypothetical protein